MNDIAKDMIDIEIKGSVKDLINLSITKEKSDKTHYELFEKAIMRMVSGTGAIDFENFCIREGFSENQIRYTKENRAINVIWLHHLFLKYKINPAWIIEGLKPKYFEKSPKGSYIKNSYFFFK
ncbi:MAG: hypothetical protein GY714_10650 [Desulfobacterales bacterium]|nr:hypothetical protein [Desulfobacterales bacterium]